MLSVRRAARRYWPRAPPGRLQWLRRLPRGLAVGAERTATRYRPWLAARKAPLSWLVSSGRRHCGSCPLPRMMTNSAPLSLASSDRLRQRQLFHHHRRHVGTGGHQRSGVRHRPRFLALRPHKLWGRHATRPGGDSAHHRDDVQQSVPAHHRARLSGIAAAGHCTADISEDRPRAEHRPAAGANADQHHRPHLCQLLDADVAGIQAARPPERSLCCESLASADAGPGASSRGLRLRRSNVQW
jgi:hypothetical protein